MKLLHNTVQMMTKYLLRSWTMIKFRSRRTKAKAEFGLAGRAMKEIRRLIRMAKTVFRQARLWTLAW